MDLNMDLGRCSIGRRLMRTLMVVEPEVAIQPAFHFRHRPVLHDLDVLLKVMDRILPKGVHTQPGSLLCSIPCGKSRQVAEVARDPFVSWFQEHAYHKAAETLLRDWDRMVASTPIESPTGGR